MSTVNPSQADFERLIASIPAETPVTSHNLLLVGSAHPTKIGNFRAERE